MKSILRGATWHGESADRDQTALADFLRKLVNKDMWQTWRSDGRPYWANDLLGLSTWSNPLGGGEQSSPINELANQSNGSPIHLVIPALALRPSINELANILETEAYTEWNYMLTASRTPPSVFTGSREYVTIVSDSTLLNWGETWKSMVRGNETLAVIAGAHGKCYADGGMDHVPPPCWNDDCLCACRRLSPKTCV